MKENELLNWVMAVAAATGWRAWHVPMPLRPIGGGRFVPESRGAGLPDLVLMHASPPRLILAELKDATGELSDEQREFMRLARAVAESLRIHLHAVREVLEGAGVRAPEVVDVANIPIGVYLWRPGMEKLIETTLKSKVLTA